MESWIEQLTTHLPYVGVVFVIALAGLGFPIPEDLPLFLGGVLCGLGEAHLLIMLPACFVAVVGGDIFIFYMGHIHKDRIRKMPLLRRYLSDERMARAADAYHSHVGKTLFTARFLPGLRAPLFFTAGSVGIPLWKMLLFDGMAALLSVPSLIFLGYYGSSNKDVILAYMDELKFPILLVVFTVIGTVVYFYFRRHRGKSLKRMQAAAVDDPAAGASRVTASAGVAAPGTPPAPPTSAPPAERGARERNPKAVTRSE